MRWHTLCLAGIALWLVASTPAAAQFAKSPGFRLTAYTFDGSGGGMSSLNVAGHTACDLSSTPMSSGQVTAIIGFLGANDPGVSNDPIVFGLQPAFGPLAGGTAFTMGGRNFDKLRSSSSLSLSIGGMPVSDLVVLSDTLLTGTTPPGATGPQDVVLDNSIGTFTLKGGFVYTPAIVTSPIAPIGSQVEIRNYGSVSNRYWTFLSFVPIEAPTQYGMLYLGPPLLQIFPPTPYPAPLGIASSALQVPDNAALRGVTVQFQSLCITQLSPLQGSLTNASSTAIR